MRRDRTRNNASAVNGYAVLRYMPERIWFQPHLVLADIAAMLRSRAGG